MASALSEYQRATIAVTFDHWGDEMLRILQERKKDLEGSGHQLSPEREKWMGDQAAAWYQLAEEIRCKRGIK